MAANPTIHRFDTPEHAVGSLMRKSTPDKIIEDARKEMMGGKGLMKSLAMQPGNQDGDRRLKKIFEFFQAALEGDEAYLFRSHKNRDAEAQELVNQGLISIAEFKALAPWNETTNSAGGYNVPNEFAADLARNLGKYGFARRYFRNWGMKSNKTNIPGLLTKPTVAVYAENATIAASKPVEDNTLLTAKKIASIFPVTNEALEDSNIDVYAAMIDIFTEQFQISEDQSAFQNSNTNWNGLLWYGAGTITSGVAANGARAYSRINNSAGGKTTFPQFGDALAANGLDNWGDLLLMLTGQPSALFQEGKFFIDQNVMVALLSARSTQGLFGVNYDSLIEWNAGPDANWTLSFAGYEIVVLPSGIMITYDASAHVSEPYTAFCNPIRSWTTMGTRGGFVIDTLKEGTLDTVSLAANDLQSLRMKERVAFATARPETVAVLRNDAS